jgi:hypothetical protein
MYPGREFKKCKKKNKELKDKRSKERRVAVAEPEKIEKTCHRSVDP